MSKLGDDFCLRLYSTSPAPKRDYQGLTITMKDITLNSWDISHGPHIYPRRQHVTMDDFYDDRRFQEEISIIFGPYVVDYILKLARGERNVHLLPEKMFLYILNMLAVNDILNLRQSSKIFFQLCNTNPIWKILYQKKVKHKISDWELKQSEIMSWQYMLRRWVQKYDGKALYKNFLKSVTTITENIQQESKPSKYINEFTLEEKGDNIPKQLYPKPVKKSIWTLNVVPDSKNLEKSTILKNTKKQMALPKIVTNTAAKRIENSKTSILKTINVVTEG